MSAVRARTVALIVLAFAVIVAIILGLSLSQHSPRASSPLAPSSTSADTISFTRLSLSGDWSFVSSSSPLFSRKPSPSSRAAPSERHTFHWLFPHRNPSWLDSEFSAITEPASPRYAAYHSKASLMAVLGPSAEDKAAVMAWLSTGGVSEREVEDNGDALRVTADVGRVERLFNTTMHRLINARTQQRATLASDRVLVPVHLGSALHRLRGLVNYPLHVARMHALHTPAPSVPSSHSMHVMQTEETNAQCLSPSFRSPLPVQSPATLAAMYNYSLRNTDTVPQPTRACVVGGFLTYAFSPLDLAHFQANVGFSANFTAVQFNGNNAVNLQVAGSAQLEPSLDIEALFQTSPTSTNSFYAVLGSDDNADLYTTLVGISELSADVRPQVVSYSYSWGYSEYDYAIQDHGATERQLQLMALLGVTIVVASGDDGSVGGFNRACSLSPNTIPGLSPTPHQSHHHHSHPPHLPRHLRLRTQRGRDGLSRWSDLLQPGALVVHAAAHVPSAVQQLPHRPGRVLPLPDHARPGGGRLRVQPLSVLRPDVGRRLLQHLRAPVLAKRRGDGVPHQGLRSGQRSQRQQLHAAAGGVLDGDGPGVPRRGGVRRGFRRRAEREGGGGDRHVRVCAHLGRAGVAAQRGRPGEGRRGAGVHQPAAVRHGGRAAQHLPRHHPGRHHLPAGQRQLQRRRTRAHPRRHAVRGLLRHPGLGPGVRSRQPEHR